MNTLDFAALFERLKANTPIRNQSQLAEILGVGRAAVSAAKQKNRVPPRWIVALAEKFDLQPSALSSPETDRPSGTSAAVISIPIASGRLVGKGQQWELETVEEESVLRISRELLTGHGGLESMIALRVSCDNMTPELSPGDVVVVNRSQCTPRIGDVFVFKLGGEVSLRRVDKTPDGLVLLSVNPVYPPVKSSTCDPVRVVVLGRVVMTIRSFPVPGEHSNLSHEEEEDISDAPRKVRRQKQYPLL